MSYLKFIFLIILMTQPAMAIGVYPSIDAGQLDGGSHEFKFFLIGDSEAHDIEMTITPRSQYLSDHVTISPGTLELKNGENREIVVTLDTDGLGPGEHELIIVPQPQTNGSGISMIAISVLNLEFIIPGNITRSLILEKLAVEDNKISLTVKNNGNVRVEARPYFDIYRFGNFLESVKGNTRYLIEPGKTRLMEVYHNLPESYSLTGYVLYGSNRTNEITKEYEIEESVVSESVSPSRRIRRSSPSPAPAQKNENILEETPVVDFGGVGEIHVVIENKEAVTSGSTIHLYALLKNKGPFVNYSAVFNVMDGQDIDASLFIEGTLNRGEIDEITKDILGNGDRIEIEISYHNGEKRKILKESLDVLTISPVTGFAAAESANPLYLLVVVLIILVVVGIKKKRKRQVDDLLKIKDLLKGSS